MIKVKITSNPITPYGSFTRNQVINSDQYPESFLLHLVNDANAAELLDYETKVEPAPEIKKTAVTTNNVPTAHERPTGSKRKTLKGKRSSSSRQGQA